MNQETTPEGEKYVTGTVGEIYPTCFEKQKDDSKRFVCLIKTGQCEHEATCFVQFQRTLNEMFKKHPEIVGARLVWSTDKKRYMTKVPAKTMIHTIFEVKEDKYSPLEG